MINLKILNPYIPLLRYSTGLISHVIQFLLNQILTRLLTLQKMLTAFNVIIHEFLRVSTDQEETER